jgi:hypothetical protein
MVSSKKDENPQSHRKPPETAEAYQHRLIALAYGEAERQLLAGTASSQVITQLLKMGTQREEVELENLRQEGQLKAAKIVAMESAARSEELFEKAMEAFRGYQPSSDDDIV